MVQVHRPVCIVGAGLRVDCFKFRFVASSWLAARHRGAALEIWAKIPIVKKRSPPWGYHPPQQACSKPRSNSSSSSDSDRDSGSADSRASSNDIKKQEKQLHRGASFVMKLPKVCFRPGHVSPGHATRGRHASKPRHVNQVEVGIGMDWRGVGWLKTA